jgi:hypothetical protein
MEGKPIELNISNEFPANGEIVIRVRYVAKDARRKAMLSVYVSENWLAEWGLHSTARFMNQRLQKDWGNPPLEVEASNKGYRVARQAVFGDKDNSPWSHIQIAAFREMVDILSEFQAHTAYLDALRSSVPDEMFFTLVK